ncbi:MAG TPA: sigma-70 family RNA polymerase sigma factor [Fodinibius sp.]|nr:sigma-70 family RNA polymerase sigma factor [Fodinibius sp.]
MDYSDLVTAIKTNDTESINTLIKAIRPRLESFLCIHMNANYNDAQDIAQDALVTIIEVIREDQLNDPNRVVEYLISICKNGYLKEQQRKQVTSVVAEPYNPKEPKQLQSMLDKEQKRLLAWCMQQLKKEFREFIQYWLDHPDSHSREVAKRFNISISNTWTRKHRLIKKLNECYQKKSNL